MGGTSAAVRYLLGLVIVVEKCSECIIRWVMTCIYTSEAGSPQGVHAHGENGRGEAVLGLGLDDGEAGLFEDFAELFVGSWEGMSVLVPVWRIIERKYTSSRNCRGHQTCPRRRGSGSP